MKIPQWPERDLGGNTARGGSGFSWVIKNTNSVAYEISEFCYSPIPSRSLLAAYPRGLGHSEVRQLWLGIGHQISAWQPFPAGLSQYALEISFFLFLLFARIDISLAQKQKLQQIICFQVQNKYLLWPAQEMAFKEHNTHLPRLSPLLLWCIVLCLLHQYLLIQHYTEPHKTDLWPGWARKGGAFHCFLFKAPHFSCKKKKIKIRFYF